MTETVPVEVLGATLALCAALVGVLANMVRREKKNNKGHNPGLLPGCMEGGVLLSEFRVYVQTASDAERETRQAIDAGTKATGDELRKISDLLLDRLPKGG